MSSAKFIISTATVFTPELLRRLDTNGPRYTSYPTADRFVDAFDGGSVPASGAAVAAMAAGDVAFAGDAVADLEAELRRRVEVHRDLVGTRRLATVDHPDGRHAHCTDGSGLAPAPSQAPDRTQLGGGSSSDLDIRQDVT